MKFSGCREIFLFSCLLCLYKVTTAEDTLDLFSRASCDFSINLLKIQSKLNEGNVVLSPNSIATLLSILQQGAKEITLEQINKVLGLTPEQSKLGHSAIIKSLLREKANVTLEWGSRAYIKPGFQPYEEYNKTIVENFGASIEEINFAESQEAANQINIWISEVTHNNIKEFVKPESISNAIFSLFNAIYFKGLWDVPFKKILTKEENFELSPNNTVLAPFMAQIERFIAGEDPETGVMWLDLPFKDDQFSMLFFLPMEKHGLNNVLEKMNGDFLKKVIEDQQTRHVTLYIPKFKLGEKIQIRQVLKEMGLIDIFTENSNLQGITPNGNLQVSQVLHEANLEIDEDGGTASAATGIIFELSSFPKASDSLFFKADHPFLFFLLDRKNKVPLFAGKVANPS